MNVSDKNHPHHAVWREHAQSVLDGAPKTVEYCTDEEVFHEAGLNKNGFAYMMWNPDWQYRIARPMVTRTISYLEPMRVAPKNNVPYWFIDPSEDAGFWESFWDGCEVDRCRLKNGVVFATEAEAQSAAKAIFGVQE